MKELTRAEEQIMQVLWDLRKGFVNDVLSMLPEPRPAYNTVSTIIRILEQKGFVSHKAYGRTHEYYPLVSKKQYTRSYLKQFMRNYFDGSYASLASFFSRDETLSVTELEEIRTLIEHAIQQKSKT
ncbi:MAG TPA: BlaI/MecI/CopY family transcriptional regulator [Bacteroidales bacterium]|nr:BlaI/MecI/CopY family transcriptional regulator [Bacteroidales bacterium]HSA42475.1 BlaI/MecI/CopY family transcriptional regulator [Bacteroidales bacterium]